MLVRFYFPWNLAAFHFVRWDQVRRLLVPFLSFTLCFTHTLRVAAGQALPVFPHKVVNEAKLNLNLFGVSQGTGFACSPDGKRIYVMTHYVVTCLDAASLSISRTYSVPEKSGEGLLSMAVSSDGEHLAVFQRTGRILILKSDTLELRAACEALASDYRPRLLALPFTSQICELSDRGSVAVIDLPTGVRRTTAKTALTQPSGIGFKADTQELLITSGNNGRLLRFHLKQQSATEVQITGAEPRNVQSGAFRLQVALGDVYHDEKRALIYVQKVGGMEGDTVLAIHPTGIVAKSAQVGRGASRLQMASGRYLFCRDRSVVDRKLVTTVIDCEGFEPKWHLPLDVSDFVLTGDNMSRLYFIRYGPAGSTVGILRLDEH